MRIEIEVPDDVKAISYILYRGNVPEDVYFDIKTINEMVIYPNDFEEWEQREAEELKFGDRIAKRLKEIGMPQRELARRCKITEVTMSRYIGNKRTPKAPVIEVIARALGVTPDYLFGYKNKEEL